MEEVKKEDVKEEVLGQEPVTERDAVYKAFAVAQEAELPKADASTEKEDMAKELANKGDEASESSDKYKAASSTEKEGKEDTEEKTHSENKKMVPYDALHEERERRKALQAEIDLIKLQFEMVSRTTQKKEEEPQSFTEGFDQNGEIVDYDVAMKSILKANLVMKKELDAVKGKSAVIENEYQNRYIQEAQNALKTRVDNTDKALADEGFPGFSEFTPLITAELNRLIAQNVSNRALDNEAGWQQIYKERIFPKVTASLGKVIKMEGFEQKKALKEKANLVAAPGSMPAKKAKEEDWTRESYMDMRNKASSDG